MGDVSEKQQKIVYFDVGGTVFRVFRDTIQNYPSSLLAKLICEFPNLGEEAKPLFVDRSPKAFEWILEIYRLHANYKTILNSKVLGMEIMHLVFQLYLERHLRGSWTFTSCQVLLILAC